MRRHIRTQVDVESIADALRETFSKQEVERVARECGFVRRLRKLMPCALLLAFATCLGCGKADWLADILRAHNKLAKKGLQYKPFHNQLCKAAFAEWMRRMLETALFKLTFPVLEAIPGSKLELFDDIVAHDGTSFAVKAKLKKTFPGRFKKSAPAAIELHVTTSGFCNAPECIQLAPDKEAEKHFRPEAKDLKGRLLLSDRALQDKRYFKDLQTAHAYYVIRGTKNIKPTIRAAYDANGTKSRRLRYLVGKQLSWRRLPRETVDLDIEWHDRGFIYTGRLVVFYKPARRNTKDYTYLHTNLDRAVFSVEDVGKLYRFRWQIELLFKEWKQHANLHRYDTEKENIVEGAIWASLLVGVLKRSITHAADLALGVELSTERAARSAYLYLHDVIKTLIEGSRRALVRVLTDAFEFLASNATRAHPKRDRKKGRLSAGLQPVGAS